MESDDDEEGIDDEVYAQKMQEQLNSSRPRRAAAMQATASMMVCTATCFTTDANRCHASTTTHMQSTDTCPTWAIVHKLNVSLSSSCTLLWPVMVKHCGIDALLQMCMHEV